MTKKMLYSPWTTIVLLALVWQGVYLLHVFPQALFPGLNQIGLSVFALYSKGDLIGKIIYSIGMIFLAVTLSFVWSMIMLVLAFKNTWLMQQFRLLESILNPLPGMAILPLVILWFGISTEGMIFIMVHAMLWPIWSQLRVKIEALVHQYESFIRSYNLSPLRAIRGIFIPGTMGEMVSAVKVAWSRGWRALISIEMVFGMVGSHTGLGWLIYERRMYMDTAGLYGVLLIIALIGIVVDKILGKLENTYGSTY